MEDIHNRQILIYVAAFRDGAAEPNDDLTLMALCVKPLNKS